jgi:hypothetical protein
VTGVLALGLASCLAAIFVSRGAGGRAPTAPRQASQDVTISSCQGDQLLDDVVNHGSGTASYMVDVAFESQSGDVQYDTAFAVVDDLAPGQTGVTVAQGFAGIPGDFRCVVTRVSRF